MTRAALFLALSLPLGGCDVLISLAVDYVPLPSFAPEKPAPAAAEPVALPAS